VPGCGIPPRYPQAVAPGGRHPAGPALPPSLPPLSSPPGWRLRGLSCSPVPRGTHRADRPHQAPPVRRGGWCVELGVVASIESGLVVPRRGGSRPSPSPDTASAKRRRRPRRGRGGATLRAAMGGEVVTSPQGYPRRLGPLSVPSGPTKDFDRHKPLISFRSAGATRGGATRFFEWPQWPQAEIRQMLPEVVFTRGATVGAWGHSKNSGPRQCPRVAPAKCLF
jgi:hypothetical protein